MKILTNHNQTIQRIFLPGLLLCMPYFGCNENNESVKPTPNATISKEKAAENEATDRVYREEQKWLQQFRQAGLSESEARKSLESAWKTTGLIGESKEQRINRYKQEILKNK